MKTQLLAVGTALFVALASPLVADPFTTAVNHLLDTSTCRTVGWSKDGKVCILQEIDGGARGATGVQFLLLDAVEDQELAKVTLWSDEYDVPADELVPAMLGSEAFGEFRKAYESYQLVFGELVLAPFPLVHKAGTFTAKAEVKAVDDGQEFGSKTLDYRIVVTSRGQGTKVVTADSVDLAYEVTIRGQVVSPFEARALVVYQITSAGFEGDRMVSLRFAGCKLTSGFK